MGWCRIARGQAIDEGSEVGAVSVGQHAHGIHAHGRAVYAGGACEASQIIAIVSLSHANSRCIPVIPHDLPG